MNIEKESIAKKIQLALHSIQFIKKQIVKKIQKYIHKRMNN